MEYHELQTLHWHYKAGAYITNDVKHCCNYTFQFLTLEDVELNQKGQYILEQNDLNKLHFTSLLQYRKLRNSILAYA